MRGKLCEAAQGREGAISGASSSQDDTPDLAPHMQPETSNKVSNINKEQAGEEEDDFFLNQQACGTWLSLCTVQPLSVTRSVK